MEEKQILKGNSLIAAFMGGEFQRKQDAFDPDRWIESFIFIGGQGNWRLRTDPAKHHYIIPQLSYHAYWDWIMPVYDKIRIVVNTQDISEQEHYAAAWVFIRRALLSADIHALWLACVGFINIHNERTP